MNKLWTAVCLLGLVMALWFGALAWRVIYIEKELRQTKVDVALLQQQMIVLLVGQGYQLQEGR